jgi:predicted RNase H-like HicB family nuclease
VKVQGYNAVMERCSRGWVVKFPQLPGLRAYGPDREQAEVMANEVITEYLSDVEGHLAALNASGNGQSVQSNIIDAVVAALGGEAMAVYRTRFTPFAVAELPADNVIPDAEEPEYQDNSDVELRHRFIIRHTAAAVDEVDKAVDLRYVRAYQLLQADPTLGGIVRYCRYVGRKWDRQTGEYDTVALAVTYEVEFSTTRSDPTVAGF